MNCELAHERIVLAAYGELPYEQVHELDRHLAAAMVLGFAGEIISALPLDAAPLVARPPFAFRLAIF